jgi:hypothetical protein
MSRPIRKPGRPLAAPEIPPMRELLREIARWALTSSLGLSAACGSYHDPGSVRQDVPTSGVAGIDGTPSGSAGNVFRPDGAGRTGMTTQPPPTIPPTGTAIGAAGSTLIGSGGRPYLGGGGSFGAAGTGNVFPPDGGVMQAPWVDIRCAGQPPGLLPEVMLARAVDYAAIFRSYAGGGLDSDGGYVSQGFASLWTATGSACATANNYAACRSTLDLVQMPSAPCKLNGVCGSFFVTTTGDEVTRSEERSSLIALLGAIDTPEKAALVAGYDGRQIACPSQGTQARRSGDGYDLRTQYDTCGGGIYLDTTHVSSSGELSATSSQRIGNSGCAIGRRPAGLRYCAPSARGSLGAFFADAARLEAASVFAFERLGQELRALGAPDALLAETARAALDEIRHARSVGSLARRFGAEPSAVEIAPLCARSPLAIALENAVEGCVRETYGALVAHYQAASAADPLVRATMRVIAEDETRHAQLAWRVAAWLEPQLPAEAQALLAQARAVAVAQLAREVDPGLAPLARSAIGWPAPELAAQMIARLGRTLSLA